MTTRSEQWTPEKIVRVVEAQEIASEELRSRMERDYGMYLLEWKDDRWDKSNPDDYYSYTSNAPRTFADRMIELLVSAKMIAQVPYGDAKAEERQFGKAKERFFSWCLRQADENLLLQVLPTLKQQLAFYIVLRGWYAGRALLYKSADGSTQMDITPFDPMHTFYAVGKGGLNWLCHKLLRTRDEIEDEYGISMDDLNVAGEARGERGDSETGITVYDFYDRLTNYVVIGKDFARDPSPHGAGRVPCFVGMVGATPFVQRRNEHDLKHLLSEVGESVYGANRNVYDAVNKTISDRMTLVRRQLEPGYVLESETGTKTLDHNPYVDRSEVPLKKGEKLNLLQLQEMTRDTDLLLGHLTGEEQRGSLPYSSYGEIQFQLSGFAINTLREGLDLKIQAGVLAMQAAYRQIAKLLCEQYATGAYLPIVAVGGIGKSYYKEPVLPEAVAEANDMEITFVPRLPKDDVSMYSMAQIAREGKTPLLSLRTTLDSILQLEDADGEIALLKEEIAETASPIAALTTLIQNAVERGRLDLAAIYFSERQAMLTGMGTAPPPAQNGKAAQAPPGLPTTAAGPPQMNGFPQAPPVPPEMMRMNSPPPS